VAQPHPDLGQLGLRGGQLLAGLVELLADLSNWVVSWLILAWTWLTVAAAPRRRPVAKTARPLTEISPAAIAIPRRIRDALPPAAYSRPYHSHHVPLPERLPRSLALATGPATFGPA